MNSLPQLERPFLTDGGLETDMLFNHGFEMQCFSSSTLFLRPESEAALTDYFRPYLDTAERLRVGFILESPSWRASPDWAGQLGLTLQQLEALNVRAVDLMKQLRSETERAIPVVISGCIGPRGDGYEPGKAMMVEEARDYHGWQIGIFAREGVDQVTAITMTNIPEATGLALAAKDAGVPVAISFTVETDGTLPSGETLAEAIEAVDEATGNYPAYFMINCAHPTHFEALLDPKAAWVQRIKGLRANASKMSHAELDEMEVLDDGDPAELGAEHRDLCARLPHLTVLGGCCGTDHRHVKAIAEAVLQD